MITNVFKRPATGEMIDAKAANTQGDMVSCAFPLLLVFSVTPFKLDQSKNQNRPVDKVQNLGNERRYIYRPSPNFRSEEYFVYEISEKMFYPNL